MSCPAIRSDGSNVLKQPPEGFEPTAIIAILVGRFDTERTLVQKWTHTFHSKDDVWVTVPIWLLHEDGLACAL